MGESDMRHYLVTQWNCDMYDLDWLLKRQKVFEKFCLPSVMAQTNNNFEWVLVSDSRTPSSFKKVLDSYPATVIYHDFENYEWKDAPPCDDLSSTMRRSTRLEYIKSIVAGYIGVQDTDYIITSRCDNDDALSKDHIEQVQAYAKIQWKADPNSDFWLSLVRGYKWNNGKVYPINSNSNPFLSFVEAPTNLQTCYQVCHTLASSSGYKMVCIRKCKPTWMQVIHEDNLLNKLKRFKGETPDDEVRARFKFN